MRVLLVSPSPKLPGGIARWTKHVLSYYEEHKETCKLDYLCTTQCKYSVKRNYLYRFYVGMLNYVQVIFKFRSRLLQINYDVVHITTSASISLLKDLCLINIAKYFNVKSIVHFRFGRIPELVEKKNWEWKLLKRVVYQADVVITLDMRSYTALVSMGFGNVKNLPNPLSNSILKHVEQSDNVIVQSRRIVFVGQMLETKGVYELVKVCSEIPDVKLEMYGAIPDGMRSKLLRVAGTNAENWLDIVGEIDYDLVIDKMMACSVFVLPTYSEGFPNVILESMACGCAIIASNVGAIPEMLAINSQKPCGICIEPRNKKELKKAIEFILDHPDIAQEYGKRAKERVFREYSIDSVWLRMVKIWKDSLIEKIVH
ncbi:glycosyltransferase family 4 protein [Butyricimonas faecihominis]|uniref:glycosyltransferase family 4 protein n=1 Tax=Butyricimonas faecihominis TaxID=1472416 RepID=UPI0032C08FB0